MASSPVPDRLTRFQRELLAAFFRAEQRFFLTGGAALAGFYFGHRETEDLDLFSSPGPSLDDAERAVGAAAAGVDARVAVVRSFPDFRRLIASREDENCVVDLVIDRAKQVDAEKAVFDGIRVDTLREIAANKLCTLLGRSEIKDLVDFEQLVASGVDLESAIGDAQEKDRGTDPASLAWVLDQITIGSAAVLPGGADVGRILAFRERLVKELRALAMRDVERARPGNRR